jgi:hypothetical protein
VAYRGMVDCFVRTFREEGLQVSATERRAAHSPLLGWLHQTVLLVCIKPLQASAESSAPFQLPDHLRTVDRRCSRAWHQTM